MAESPAPSSAADEPSGIDSVRVSLGGSEALEMLGITDDDFELARTDSDLLETLRITNELLIELGDAGVLETFLRLPEDDQANFLRWVGMTDDPELRRSRTETFVLALQESPLGDP